MFLNISNNFDKSFLQLLTIPTSLIKLTWVGFVIVSRVSEISLACLVPSVVPINYIRKPTCILSDQSLY